ncbi:MAG: hypothetical protein Q9O62_00805 [Ardenticatenia bacterium]|nr:hypothetical protein [Ardenticatenia bacterium]
MQQAVRGQGRISPLELTQALTVEGDGKEMLEELRYYFYNNTLVVLSTSPYLFEAKLANAADKSQGEFLKLLIYRYGGYEYLGSKSQVRPIDFQNDTGILVMGDSTAWLFAHNGALHL